MKRYTPDFPEMMRLCEMNFSQLRRLLPRNDAPGETVSYQVANASFMPTHFLTLDDAAAAIAKR